MSTFTSSWTPSDFALTQEEETWLPCPIAPKKPILCAGTLYRKKKKAFPLGTISMAI